MPDLSSCNIRATRLFPAGVPVIRRKRKMRNSNSAPYFLLTIAGELFLEWRRNLCEEELMLVDVVQSSCERHWAFTVPQQWARRNVKRVEMRCLIPNVLVQACRLALTGPLFKMWGKGRGRAVTRVQVDTQCALYFLLMRDLCRHIHIEEGTL